MHDHSLVTTYQETVKVTNVYRNNNNNINSDGFIVQGIFGQSYEYDFLCHISQPFELAMCRWLPPPVCKYVRKMSVRTRHSENG